jgi:membrane-bound metal-dependent hydrolase YbcI (DUF457 family)
MFVGHGLLAFALVAWGAAVTDIARRQALVLGGFAGLFATVPDVDISYALVGLATAEASNLSTLASVFWEAGNLVHRGITHSLLVAVVVTFVVGCWVYARRAQPAPGWDRSTIAFAGAGGLALAVLGITGAVSGPLGASIMALFVLATVAVTETAVRVTEAGHRTVGLVALVGVLSHPFGDLLTGQPPAMLYPLDVTLVAERLSLGPDPTIHLLAAFGIELLTVWLAVVVLSQLTGRSVVTAIDRRAALGMAYATGVFVIPAPTLDVAHQFVFSVLGVGVVGAVPTLKWDRQSLSVSIPGGWTVLSTGLAAVTVAWLAYAFAYLSIALS